MNQLTEEQRERLRHIKANRQVWYGGYGQMTADIDFLLSLLDSPVVDPITYYNQDGSYNPVGKNIANHASTAMRDACVEKVRGLRHKSEPDDSRWNAALYHAEKQIESLTLDQVQEKRDE